MISVIIPVYKVEQYLRQCLDSVINQSYKDLEIIVIDDGSPDNCGAICDEYAARDSRIKLVHQENKGLSAARNVALGLVTGDWIAFVDSDDWCELGMYEKAVSSISGQTPDIVMFGSYRNYEGTQYVNQIFKNDFITSDPAIIFQLQLSTMNAAYAPYGAQWREGYPWDKLYRASLILDNHLTFAEHVRADEDIIFNLHAFQFARTVSYINVPLYHYRYNPTSIGYKFTPNRPEIDRCIYEEMISIGGKYNLSEKYYEAVDTFYTNTIMLCGQRCFFHHEQTLSLPKQLQAANNVLHTEPVFSVLGRVNKAKLGKLARLFLFSRHHNVLLLYAIAKLRPQYLRIKQRMKK